MHKLNSINASFLMFCNNIIKLICHVYAHSSWKCIHDLLMVDIYQKKITTQFQMQTDNISLIWQIIIKIWFTEKMLNTNESANWHINILMIQPGKFIYKVLWWKNLTMIENQNFNFENIHFQLETNFLDLEIYIFF